MTKDSRNTAIYIAFDDDRPFDPSEPEKNLLRAILATAMSDLRGKGEARRKALEYFLSAEDDYIFSFQSVCNYLALDPKTILFVVGLHQSDVLKRPEPKVKTAQTEPEASAQAAPTPGGDTEPA